MSLWSDHLLPRAIDRVCGLDRLDEFRHRACEGLRGRVLELGFGSGHNVSHYPPEVDQVDAVEPSDVAWKLAAPRLGRTRARVGRVGLDGQRLDAPSETYDAALTTFTLCTIPDLTAALREVLRVLRPGGALHVLEHGKAPDASVARWQSWLQPLHGRIAGGCHLDRQIDAEVTSSGLVFERLETFYGPAPRPFGYLYLGVARKTSRSGRA